MNKIDGRVIAERILGELAGKSQNPEKKVAFVVIKDDPVIEQFVQRKVNIGERLSIACDILRPTVASTQEAVAYIASISEGDQYDGIVVQLPLPSEFDLQSILDAVPLEKDIDMLSSRAKAEYAAGNTTRIPPVAAAVSLALAEKDIELSEKQVVIIGHGRLVGEPVALMLEHGHVSYKIIDIATSEHEREELLAHADVIISGAGVPHMITTDMVKEGVILIDAGTSGQSGKLVGDIDPSAHEKASFYTPVPGGIGPITVATLFQNLFL